MLGLLLPTSDFGASSRTASGGGTVEVESLLDGEAAREDGCDCWACWTLWEDPRSDDRERRRAKLWRRERVGEEGEGSGLVGEGAVVNVRGRDGWVRHG